MRPGRAVLGATVALAIAFVAGYLLGLSAPAPVGGSRPRTAVAPVASRTSSGTPSASGPRIRFAEELFDFGTVDQGQKVVHVYEFTNVGDAPLDISEVTTSCGCTATMLSSSKLAPGQKGQVRAEFDSQKYHDQVQIWLHLFTNDPRRRQATILLQGKVSAFVKVDPQELDLGLVREGQEVRGSIRVEAARMGERFRVTGVTTSSDSLVLGPVREDPTHPEAAYTVEVSLRGRPPYGMLWDYVRLQTDHPKRSTLEVKVSRTVTSASEQAPASPSAPGTSAAAGTPAPGGTTSPSGAHHR